ncbi:MAG: hypothetical protein GYA50_01670 [Eubacteriaceae bacterium]|nr:hypothetical protein [Eubacteriaceae bacterium]
MSNYQIPKLIPAFSSKGNVFLNFNDKIISDNYILINKLEKYLFNTYLISAYDIYYGFMPDNLMDFPLANTIMIDSGGYEILNSYDICENYKYNYKIYPWDENKMLEIYKKIYNNEISQFSQLIFSTYDINTNLTEQISKACILKQMFPNSIIDFLIKLPNNIYSLSDFIINSISEPLNFRLIGFTEKELGLTLREKLLTLIKIKNYFEQMNWIVDIHIFGGLEPNILILYFLAGATVFDGLSWQKVRYSENSTLHNPKYYMINQSEIDNKFWMLVDNLNQLELIENKLEKYLKNNDMKNTRNKLMNILKNENLFIEQILEQMGGL